MIGIAEAFAPCYAPARQKFLQASVGAGLRVDAQALGLRGLEREQLAMDVTLDGDPDAPHLLIVTSACHGVEGHCGSGVQVFALHDAEWREKARAAGVAVLYVHALNPHGFSYGRRVTQENVDLNRNFVDFSRPRPVNAAYAALDALLLPAEWPPSPANEAVLAAWVGQHGLPAYQAAVTGGQYQFEDGLFFGGAAPTWSQRAFRSVLQRQATRARRIGWIDLHTGLGPSGVGERICACRDDAAALQRTRDWWASGGQTPVTSIYDGSSTSAKLTGLMWSAAYEECPQAEYTGIALEYGTKPFPEVLQALRADHWLHRHPQAPEALRQVIRQQMRDAFYVDTDHWRIQVVGQARQALFQAVDGLSA